MQRNGIINNGKIIFEKCITLLHKSTHSLFYYMTKQRKIQNPKNTWYQVFFGFFTEKQPLNHF